MIQSYKELIKQTIVLYQDYKIKNILSINDLNIALKALNSIYEQCIELEENNSGLNSKLSVIKNDLTVLFRSYGINSLNNLIKLLYNDSIIKQLALDSKYEMIQNYCHPISYQLHSMPKRRMEKNLSKIKIVDETIIINSAKHLECFDLCRIKKEFNIRVSGIRICILIKKYKQILIVDAIVDDLALNNLDYIYIVNYNNQYKSSENNLFKSYLNTLRIKDKLIYNNEEISYKYEGILTYYKLLKNTLLNKTIQDFINEDMYIQRNVLIKLLLDINNIEHLYIAYLLYDLLSNDSVSSLDSINQEQIYNSLPWSIKINFKIAMKHTMEYTNKLLAFDYNKVPLEQKICLLKAPNNVKEKAMTKLKEIKAKPEDSGGKAKHYLDGLLKIPFGVYYTEPVLNMIPELLKKLKDSELDIKLVSDLNNLEKQMNDLIKIDYSSNKSTFIMSLKNISKRTINHIIKIVNELILNNKLDKEKIDSRLSKDNIIKEIIVFIEKYYQQQFFYKFMQINYCSCFKKELYYLKNDICSTQTTLFNYMKDVNKTLNVAVHGHTEAKRQIERVIGQWISGEPIGYTLGFEGPPGIGKTSLAKEGIAKCLINEHGNSRPFAFIAIGGEPNSSTICGHNYTYVGSNWGKIVDIVQDKKIMNPIFFIDELDKISKTEQGKEIIGVLTHIIDSTQNMHFQDRFFSGIDLDISKALFIFSYNDVSCIDRILLDRIHRIKFNHLSIKDKKIIVNKHILPKICKSMNLDNCINISEDVIEFIISNYTHESGVRKLKELLFEIIGEINLELINKEITYNFPITITIDNIKDKYLKNHVPIIIQKIYNNPRIGFINGLWANAQGNGGITHIECMYFNSCTPFDLKLTGQQGDVMKESMTVAKNLAWSLLTKKEQQDILKKFKSTKNQGIHIHVPEGATPKDGPSAGTAITICLYSLFSNKPISNIIAITGEINLSGNVTAIGGLDSKILGGIKAGIKQFIFPEQNKFQYDKFITKYKEDKELIDIKFNLVNTIEDVKKICFDIL